MFEKSSEFLEIPDFQEIACFENCQIFPKFPIFRSPDFKRTSVITFQAEFGETNQLMPIQLNIYLGKDIVDAQINRLEELQQFFRNQHVVDKEKIAKIQAALRNATI